MQFGYHHLDIRAADQIYFGFSWDFGKWPDLFVFTVLPVGLSAVPYLFTPVFQAFSPPLALSRLLVHSRRGLLLGGFAR